VRRHSIPARLAVALVSILLLTAAGSTPVFSAPTRLGFEAGDDWEPAIAADTLGNVFATWTHYGPDPACPSCASPHTELQISHDGGATWDPPRALVPSDERQDDPQIEVDPADGTTLYAAFMQANKASEYVARSDDHGVSWHPVLVEPLQRGTDKDILAVRGGHVYLAYHTQQKIFVSASHDGGATWTLQQPVKSTAKLGVSLPSGGAVDSSGTVFFAWNGITRPGQAKGDINLYVTRSTDGGATWSTTLVAVSAAPPVCDCPGWDYWGAQMALGVDGSDRVHVLWNASSVDGGPNRVLYAQSDDHGASFSAARDVSTAPAGVNGAFPALVTTGTDGVAIAWMDDRNGHDAGGDDPAARWNTYLRASDDGGTSFGPLLQLSAYVPGYAYKLAEPSDGFLQPYGDYFELASGAGKLHALWGEGTSYFGPGTVWYAGS
jgi:hypothetical protein